MNFKRFHESKNLFDEDYGTITTVVSYKALYVGNGEFTLSTTAPQPDGDLLFLLAGNVSSGASTSTNGVDKNQSRTVTAIDGYITIGYVKRRGDVPSNYQTMLNTGSTPQPYEPYSSEVWHDIPYYQHKTATDTLTLPATLYPNDTSITVGLKGNEEHTGTPSPQNPVDVLGCGERTNNLFDKDNVVFSGFYPHADTGAVVNTTSGKLLSIIVPCEPNTSYVWSFDKTLTDLRNRVAGYSAYPTVGMACTFLDRGTESPSGSTRTVQKFTTTAETHWLILMVTGTGQTTETLTEDVAENAQLEIGTEMTSYKPYGYKLPINSRGKNLFDKDNAPVIHIFPTASGVVSERNDVYSIILPCKPNTTYTYSKLILPHRMHRVAGYAEYPTLGMQSVFLDESSETIEGDEYAQNIFTTTADAHWLLIIVAAQATYDDYFNLIQKLQVEESNERTSYEPYIEPTETNIYLGEVETTRKIRKVVFDGTENWAIDTTNNIFFYVNHLVDNVRQINGFCTHFRYFVVTSSNTSNGVCVTSNGAVRLRYSECNTVDDFKSFLAQQYSAGTPVCVWYVLATPETAVVNEPLRKIGDYADEVSSITIPVTAGENTISVDTTLQPSEVTVNYKGWHPVADVHEADNGAWT